MSSGATDPTDKKTTSGTAAEYTNASPSVKGKGKAQAYESMEEEEDDDDDDDEEEEEGEEEEEEEDVEESLEEIDPSAILPQGRRTRGIKVDYTSQEAIAKAGLKGDEDEEEDDDVVMKD